MWSLATHTRTLTVSQDTIKGRKSSPKDVGRGGGCQHPSQQPIHFLRRRRRRGMDITSKPFISPNSNDNDQPRKVNLTPLSMNNSGTLRKENSVCPHAGVHRTCLTITESIIEENDSSLQVTKEWMALWPVDHAASVDTSKSPRTDSICRGHPQIKVQSAASEYPPGIS